MRPNDLNLQKNWQTFLYEFFFSLIKAFHPDHIQQIFCNLVMVLKNAMNLEKLKTTNNIRCSFIYVIIFYFCLDLSSVIFAQEVKTCMTEGMSNCGVLEVSNKETVHLTFPSRVKYVDLGSSFFVFKLDSVLNLVKIKAKRYDPTEISNLTVVTVDNYLYSFKIKITDNIPHLTYVLQTSNIKVPPLMRRVPDYCYLSLNHPLKKSIFTVSKKNIKLTLLSTYYADNRYIFTYSIKNESKIPFHIESLNLAIQKTKSPVRQKIAYQEVILYADEEKCNFKERVDPGKEVIFSLIYPKFYPPPKFKTYLYLNEKMEEYARSIKKKLNFKKIANMQILE